MSGVDARRTVEDALRRELFGPLDGDQIRGVPLKCAAGAVHFGKVEESRGQFHDADTGQEILTSGTPLTRYGIGVLYPGALVGGSAIDSRDLDDTQELVGVTGVATTEDNPQGSPIEITGRVRHDVADSDDFDLADANAFKPSAMAISFQCRTSNAGTFTIALQAARYEKLAIHLPGLAKPVEWWVRRPFQATGAIPGRTLLQETNRLKVVDVSRSDGIDNVPVAVRVFSRPVSGSDDDTLRLVTVAVVNDTPGSGPASALFQVGFSVSADEGSDIAPYPEVDLPDRDAEQKSLDLLYRNQRTYAIGHGCAAEWGVVDESGNTSRVDAVALPAHEVVSLSPNVYLADATGNPVRDANGNRTLVSVSMKELAEGSAEGGAQVELVLSQYEAWIERRESEISALLPRYQHAAREHMLRAREALERMREGWGLLFTNALAARTFRWANEAMLMQQIRSSVPLREVKQGSDRVWRVAGAHPTPVVPEGRGLWRPFQIAFLLAVLPELIEPERPSRAQVDLIFFPTGGGKTEAYLGAAAVSLLARRLRNPNDVGTDTLMRYTLRLLTAQQFLRAASLVCVLEDIRERNSIDLGGAPFGIGIWLGGSSTPNSWRSALDNLRALRTRSHEQNLFLLLRCPWCGTQMGPQQKRGGGQEPIGYEEMSGKVVFRCIDPQCKYARRSGLPVHVVDEDIYDVRPSIVIGTVDKFAMMAWRPMARRLFGLDDQGARNVSPPSLIIQDELHLISGPLGSMVGLYEPMIDELCTDRRGAIPVPPKVIASTATVRRYEDQVRSLFGRGRVALFPPHGLEEGRSFFAEPATKPDGSREPGRRYIGVMSASLGSTQTVQVRVTAATLQAATTIPEADRDGYWTNLNFLNSLRELGNTVSLLESDVPDYLTGLIRRDGIDPRWPQRTMELTSRRRSDEIPKAIEQLQVKFAPGKDRQEAVDICLASNIIEVGVDIDRLGLMTIVGQPKTTAQYIQVSGRVGRKPEVSPGLVITIYGAAKPRDRSHYERFRTYHQQLYAQVEPTSLTPFATPVLRRALHAAAVAYIRQTSPVALGPDPFPKSAYDQAIDLLRGRAAIADPHELPALDHIARERARQWDGWERTQWDANPAPFGDPLQGLMRFAGTLPDLGSRSTIWDVPTSMRNVDAECQLEISQAYLLEDTTPEELP
ncbi:helicase [Leifsonia sp. Leaf336]|uniref:helicase-related protein n=1 Tax=Leifsonia sp. Leaf336 TaxID=1736341 RepID=UPI0006F4E4A0|nr:helicase-related protein [Leifsonia sp. Leaf336]KQR52356.1 helicase [Leifsonia sp. Leaf336]